MATETATMTATGLRRNAIGLREVTFQSITDMAPGAAIAASIPAGVAFLPGLMLNGRVLTESNVPLISYWLLALAPLALTPFLTPVLNRKNGWIVRLIRSLLILAPVVIAVLLAAQNEKLVFEEEW